jgi:hypothetical protein
MLKDQGITFHFVAREGMFLVFKILTGLGAHVVLYSSGSEG